MAKQSEDIDKMQRESRLQQIVMSDPFSDTTRRTKRNLLFASVATLIIINLKLNLVSLLGFKAESGFIPYKTSAGITALFALYSLIMLIYYFRNEYHKWNQSQEIAKTADMFKIIGLQEDSNETTLHEVSELKLRLEKFPPQKKHEYGNRFEQLRNSVTQFTKKYEDNWDAIKPMHEAWKQNLKNIEEKGDSNIKFKIWGMGILEFGLPVTLGIIAIYQGRSGIFELISKVF